MKNLKGKVVLVTGATRGVGKGIAIGLGEAGATVYVTLRYRYRFAIGERIQSFQIRFRLRFYSAFTFCFKNGHFIL